MAELEKVLPKHQWLNINRLLVPFGKHFCTGPVAQVFRLSGPRILPPGRRHHAPLACQAVTHLADAILRYVT